MDVKAFGLTHVGKQRQHNEDSYLVESDARLFLVADGMGGHAAGEVASNTAIQAIVDFTKRHSEDSGVTWPFVDACEMRRSRSRAVVSMKRSAALLPMSKAAPKAARVSAKP